MNAKRIVRIGIFSALVVTGAMLSIPMVPVAITLQTLFLMLAVLVLPGMDSVWVPIIYLVLGLVGLPIFSGFTGGLAVIWKPSFGFILGFVVAAFFAVQVGKRFSDFKSERIAKLFTFNLVLYAVGLPYMYYILNYYMGKPSDLQFVLKYGFLLFLPGDILKSIIAYVIAGRLKHAFIADKR